MGNAGATTQASSLQLAPQSLPQSSTTPWFTNITIHQHLLPDRPSPVAISVIDKSETKSTRLAAPSIIILKILSSSSFNSPTSKMVIHNEFGHHTLAQSICPEYVVPTITWAPFEQQDWRVWSNYVCRRQNIPCGEVIHMDRMWNAHKPSYMLMHHCNRGSLWTVMQQDIVEFTLADWKSILAQPLIFLVKMQHLHPNWKHRDLHASNIFVVSHGDVKEDNDKYGSALTRVHTWRTNNNRRRSKTDTESKADNLVVSIHNIGISQLTTPTSSVLMEFVVPPFLHCCELKIGDFEYASSGVDATTVTSTTSNDSNQYYDVHTFLNGLLQSFDQLIGVAMLHVRKEQYSKILPNDHITRVVHVLAQVRMFLESVVPSTMRYKDSFRDCQDSVSGCRQISTGRLRDTDPQFTTPADILETHPFFESLRRVIPNTVQY